jgi:hypothetical protein
MIQLTPEAMDLFLAGVEDRPGVLYQCTCAQAPPPSTTALARSFASPWRALSSALFTTMYGLTARYDEQYPCAAVEEADQAQTVLLRAFGKVPGARANDGVVPVLSQIWGKVAWAGYADHLDVLGHFPGATTPRSFWKKLFGSRDVDIEDAERSAAAVQAAAEAAEGGGVAPPPAADTVHVDWLRSGSGFDERAFSGLMDALAKGMLGACYDP